MNQNTKISRGVILIATPRIQDSHFKNSVVLILDHDEEGILGLVLNRPSNINCSQIVKTFDVKWSSRQNRLLIGGPVDSQSLWILHTDDYNFEHTQGLFNGVNLSRSEEALTSLCNAKEDHIRLFLGYASWGAKQLEREIMEGSWWSSEADADLIFETQTDEIWH